MQRRKFLTLFGLGGAACSAPLAFAAVVVVKSHRDEVSAIIPAEKPKLAQTNSMCIIPSDYSVKSFQFGNAGDFTNTRIGISPGNKEEHILTFKVDDVTLKSSKFVEIEPGSYVMMFKKG